MISVEWKTDISHCGGGGWGVLRGLKDHGDWNETVKVHCVTSVNCIKFSFPCPRFFFSFNKVLFVDVQSLMPNAVFCFVIF